MWVSTNSVNFWRALVLSSAASTTSQRFWQNRMTDNTLHDTAPHPLFIIITVDFIIHFLRRQCEKLFFFLIFFCASQMVPPLAVITRSWTASQDKLRGNKQQQIFFDVVLVIHLLVCAAGGWHVLSSFLKVKAWFFRFGVRQSMGNTHTHPLSYTHTHAHTLSLSSLYLFTRIV